MNNQLRILYQQLKEGKISREDALKQFKLLETQNSPKQIPSGYDDGLARASTQAGRKSVPAVSPDLLPEKTNGYFTKLFSAVVRLPPYRMGADVPFEKYGIDSLMVMQLTNELEKVFGSLSKTLLFEYQTIRELAGYFLESHRDRLVEILEAGVKTIPDGGNNSTVMDKPALPVIQRPKPSRLAVTRIPAPEKKITGALDIAIIGVSGRYPGARDTGEFWRNLRDGKDCITEIPKERWDHSLYFSEDKNLPGKTYSKWGGFLEGVDQFDPLFFNISPVEAEIMEPQERLFLECVYETLEDAGYSRPDLGGCNTGVYVGVMYEEYQLYGAQEQIQGRPLALSGNPSSIANRVSYFCNFHGPSLAIDTMCSSALMAIHLACQNLQRGGCELAIAGGVNVSIHPNKFLMLAQGKFASSKGRCESFGEGGDGYVPGEGVGAVLLKPLAKAVADRDHIYGVIKGTAVNHGGKTNGYTVPNPNAQAAVIGQALKEAGIDPRTISYIEAHGTGTSLGDPIEITGLTKAFRDYTTDNQFCAIGSVKSNIGHCESAAGIAGVTKVLLQLKNGQLVPSLHSEVLNSNIDFNNTPFVVQHALTEWKRPVIGGRELPRRAGVSSFGAGGSNAHIVIEEYMPEETDRPSMIMNAADPAVTAAQEPAVIVLSAKSEEQLREQVRRLLAALNEGRFTDADLVNIAYTLQVGREAMEERLGMIAGSVRELGEKLQALIENRDGIDVDDVYRGQAKSDNEALSVFTAGDEMREAVDKLIARKKYGKVLELWVKGLALDWNKFYGDIQPRRISLPTYPFTKETYWVPEAAAGPRGITKLTSGAACPQVLHPLLHQNISDVNGLRFSSTFTGEELFFKNFMVKGQRVLPEAACLEMARAAVIASFGAATEIAGARSQTGEDNRKALRFQNVVWDRPVMTGGQPVRVDIELFPENNGEFDFEIYSWPCIQDGSGGLGAVETGQLEPIPHSRGIVCLNPVSKIPTLDIQAIQARCNQNIGSSTENEGIEAIFAGPDQLLVKLSLPGGLARDTMERLILHPVLLDAAIQASTGFSAGLGAQETASPLALQELEVIGGCTPEMWAWVQYNKKNKNGIDIDLCDEQGTVQVRMKGLTASMAEEETNPVKPPAAVDRILFQAEWQEQAIPEEALSSDYTVHRVFLYGMGDGDRLEAIRETICAQMNGAICHPLQSKHKGLDKRFQDFALRVFDEIRNICQEKPADKALIQIVIPNHGEYQVFAGLLGLLKTARLENSKMVGQLIETEALESALEIASQLKESRSCPEQLHIRYQNGKRWVAGWSEMNSLEETGETVNLPWKDGGVYLITGGAGGLGLIFAGEIAGKVKNPVLILTGRSRLSMDKQAQLKGLEAMGARIIYRQMDVADKKAVVALIQSIVGEFGSLQGIIHSAGVIRDNFIINKANDELCEVLAPKVTGLINLDMASKDLNLDFLILFSSIAGCMGNLGQADYAAANAFMDAYAKVRNHMVALNRRRGHTLSINWPLWKAGGMRSDQASEQLMAQTTGLIAMETRTGIRALYRGMISGKDQVMVLEGDLRKVRAILSGPKTGSKASNVRLSNNAPGRSRGRRPEMKGLNLEQCLEWDLKWFINRLLKISRDKIDRHKNLAEFGFNSIGLTQLAIQLIKHYGIEEITPALFFRHSTIEKLTRYLLTEHQETIREFYREDTGAPGADTPIEPGIPPGIPVPSKRRAGSRGYMAGFTRRGISQRDIEPIAIIGMSGRFPGARNIEELWTVLATGQDMVQEIPKERFDWREYYGDPAKEPGKINSKWCGCIPGAGEFDPLFFEISPKEAEITDPRQRLLLEESWKALEDAGYGTEQINAQKIGMFVGVEQGDYQFLVQGGGSVTSNNNAILASRLAYFLNLNGPVMAIDTACSSGLVAAHQAILSLRNFECDAAIAAGVNLLLTPAPYVVMSQAGMLSEDGKCHAFDKRANGMVPGEAVAVVILKRLSRAEADGDPIYAVIRGSGINYDGKTNGITAPNGVAQTRLLKAIYDQYRINPEEIEYIMTHGTGTKLGDPVEINALYDAFKDYTSRADAPCPGARKQCYCALTSTKTNFGHSFAASGLVSLISLVQALRYETIPASLHCEQENDYINWKESPFYVNKTNRPWLAGEGRTRTGAVSAFGMSGTNAHMVVQSYPEDSSARQDVSMEPVPYYMLALSAKTEESLAEKIKDLIKVLEIETAKAPDLSQISYTLLKGRQHFSFRAALVIQDREDAVYVLKQVGGKEKLPNLFRGKVPRDFTGQKVIEQYAQDLLQTIRTSRENRARYQEILYALADLYCQGYEMDWRQLFGGRDLPRIHLPAYPFAREYYWAPKPGIQSGLMASSPAVTAYIHPLLHRNTSDFSEQRFSSTFTGGEFFIKDHTVKGQRILPGTVALEMARAAVISTFGAMEFQPFQENRAGVRLTDVVWNQPIIFGEQPVRIHIGLYPQGSGVAYQIYTSPSESGAMETDQAEPAIYSQGFVVLKSTGGLPNLNLPALKAQCNRRAFTADQIYETFKAAEIEYGPGYQGIEGVWAGQDQVLAKLSLPVPGPDIQNQCVLYPGIIDLALQLSIVLMMDSGAPKPLGPVALRELEISGKCPAALWVFIRYSEGCGVNGCAGKVEHNPLKFDMDFGDDQGTVWLRLKEITAREVDGTVSRTCACATSETSSPVNSSSSGGPHPGGRGRLPEMKGLSIEQCLEWDLREQISRLLKIGREKIESDANLADFGFDSISLAELASRLTKHYGIEITPAIFFGYSTVEKMTQYFLAVHPKAVEEFYQEDTGELEWIAGDDRAGFPVTGVGPRAPKPGLKKSRFVGRSFASHSTEPIAIIGISGRFPGARNIDELWNCLITGQDMIKEIPLERFDWRQYYGDARSEHGGKDSGKTSGKWCGCIPGVSEFEPLFFEIAPVEAETMDPRQRLLLQESWKALEDAGYGTEQIKHQKIGMFVGAEQGDYQLIVQGEGGITSNHNAIMASRLAYYLNLNGPVMAIDTSCSSGLVAAHQAILSLRGGECDTAIAAGVNLMLTPAPFLGMSQAGMLSAGGKCYAFDKRANGLVPGEAVAVVVLKSLSRAEADGDPIYAVIRGSAINYDGKTNGITAPSVISQASLLKTVYDQYGVNPEDIEYIVTHGTGTRLGDPVEINALYDAFVGYTPVTGARKQGYCALTSNKTNFGHSFAASGIVNLINLVQALRHETIPASLHCEQENDYIHWKESPFYVNKTNRPWPCAFKEGGAISGGRVRMGAVSAFGMSGTNAHMVVQSYAAASKNTFQDQAPYYLLVFSAKTGESLAEKIKDMIEVLQNKDIPEFNLSQVSYTLLEGRHHFSHRCAVVIRDREDAVYALQQAGGSEKLPNLFQGKVPRDFKGQKAIRQYARELVNTGRNSRENKIQYQEILLALAELYCQGYEMDCKPLFGDLQPARIHLPTYPFVREHYWFRRDRDSKGIPSNSTFSSSRGVHPLLHQNTSTLFEQRYSSLFTGREFFLADHGIKGRRILPGMVFLEMARAAVEAAAGVFTTGGTGLCLQNIVWTEPVVAGDGPVPVHIGLFPEENGRIAYEIYTTPNQNEMDYHGPTGDEADRVILNQGSAVWAPVGTVPVGEMSHTGLTSIQAQCGRTILSSAELYEAFKMMNVDYGPGYQGIETVYTGQDQALAKIVLPAAVSNTQAEFSLHPSMMDSVLQATARLIMNSNNLKPVSPVALQELEILRRSPSTMWAVIRNTGGMAASGPWRLDIDLYDETGTVWARMKGLEIHEEVNLPVVLHAEEQEVYELMAFEEIWQEKALPDQEPLVSPAKPKTLVCFLSNPQNQQALIEAIRTHDPRTEIVFISQSTAYRKQDRQTYDIVRTDRETYRKAFQSIREAGDGYPPGGEVDAILYLWPLEDPSCIEDYTCIVYMIQAMVSAKLKAKRVLLAAQFKSGLDRCRLESWIGFERSLGLILPDTQVAAIYQPGQGMDRKAMRLWARNLWMELQVPKARSVLYQDGKRYQCQIRPTVIPSAQIRSGDNPLKPGGTYFITGGCGGLGMIFAEHLAKGPGTMETVNLILTGRSVLDAEKQSKIKTLEDLGSQVLYLQADVCDPISMKEGLNRAKERFGAIHGVIHAAGIADTQIIFGKEIESFQKVLEPKIKGTLVLDELLADEPLDFVCYFSSSAAILGDFGSCDYAVANRFLMAHAHYRNQQQLNRERSGKTVVINWPLWKDGGMGFGNDDNAKMYLKSSGQRSLETNEGLAVFDRILAQQNTQYLVLPGRPDRVHRFLGLIDGNQSPQVPPSTSSPAPGAYNDTRTLNHKRGRRPEMKGLSVEQCLEWDLKEQIRQLLKISRDKLDVDENLADIGFDSIRLAQLANVLTGYYGIEITPALFFGYATIKKLTRYFSAEYPEAIREFYREDAPDDGPPQPDLAPIAPVAGSGLKQRSRQSRFMMGNASSNIPESIAIIGMSGRFPEARNIEELWKILAAGRDVVQDIPLDRFDWRKYDSGIPFKCGCIPGVSEFEPLFFEISPKEAEVMDPRQRLLLQESWRALEDAGYGAGQINAQKIGMFVGVEQGDYHYLTKGEGGITSNNNAILAARLAYFLNLSGPVMALDTACSSGLVAAHQAILSLRNEECDTAIAAGVNLLLTPAPYLGMGRARMLSEDGRCYAFDKRANGMVPGEAVAVVVLKRLSRAEADDDPVYAVIKASGVNYDGKTNGITAPNGVSQANLLKSVYERHRINPEEIEYIVTHGTGTKLGDPVEINALYDAFKDYASRSGAPHASRAPRASLPKQGYCALTSTKTNFGHTFAASGLVSLISLVQALRHETIPASLHCEQENDYINWKESPFYVNKTNRPWPCAFKEGAISGGKVRMGAASAFGMSGTNAHMVVQSYDAVPQGVLRDQIPYYLLVFSAKTEESLSEKIKDMIEVLQNRDIQPQGLLHISYTLLEGRQHFNHRYAAVIQDREDAIYVLNRADGREKLPNLFQGKVPRDFTGQKVIEQSIQDLLNTIRTSRQDRIRYQEILFALADLYCQGYEMDWKQLFGDLKPRRIHLPAYPFTRERYWVEEVERESGADSLSHLENVHFDEPFYSQLIDELMNDSISTDVAVRKTKELKSR